MRARLALPLSAVALSVLLVAGCGVSEGDESSQTTATTEAPATTEAEDTTTTTTAPEDDSDDDGELSEEDQAAIEAMVEVYTGFGFTEEEATCLAEGVADLTGEDIDSFDPTDTASIMDLINECDIPISKLNELGANTDGSMEGGFKLGLQSSLEQQGLTEEQAQCVADGYVEQFGTDVSASQDPQKMVPLFESCGAG
jgi:CRISPR/Cas system type I-B associated protein Csh2 (Cas7 group RAMP superfamily)